MNKDLSAITQASVLTHLSLRCGSHLSQLKVRTRASCSLLIITTDCEKMSSTKEVPFSSLGEDTQALVRAAVAARQMAYCPYSNFQVGASLLTQGGHTFAGCNVENAAYGATICAERTAAVKAVSSGEKGFTSLVVTAHLDTSYVSPCGTCRQFLAEFGIDTAVYLAKPDLSTVLVTDLRSLLPLSFSKYNTHQ